MRLNGKLRILLAVILIGVVLGFTRSSFAAWGDADLTFGVNGTYIDTTDGLFVKGLKIQPDGKILVTGYTNVTVNQILRKRFFLRRYLANGGRDMAFGNNGVAIVSGVIAVNADYLGKEITVLANGNIVVLGEGNGKLMTWTFYSSGNMKSTRSLTNFPANQAHIASIESTAYVSAYRTANSDLHLIRLDSNGAQDMSFNGSGYSLTVFGGSGGGYFSLHALVAEPETGKLTIAGILSTSYVALDRKWMDGSNDISLTSQPEMFDNSSPEISKVVRQSNGNYVVTWSNLPPGTLLGYYTRFNASGGVLGRGGLGFNPPSFLGIQQDGKVIVSSGLVCNRHDADFTMVESLSPVYGLMELTGDDRLLRILKINDDIVFTRWLTN